MAVIPQDLAFAKAKEIIVQSVNSALGELNVPPYQVEAILTGLVTEVSTIAKAEMEKSFAAYQAELEAEQKTADAESVDPTVEE